jgi:hypothetical protein
MAQCSHGSMALFHYGVMVGVEEGGANVKCPMFVTFAEEVIGTQWYRAVEASRNVLSCWARGVCIDVQAQQRLQVAGQGAQLTRGSIGHICYRLKMKVLCLVQRQATMSLVFGNGGNGFLDGYLQLNWSTSAAVRLLCGYAMWVDLCGECIESRWLQVPRPNVMGSKSS